MKYSKNIFIILLLILICILGFGIWMIFNEAFSKIMITEFANYLSSTSLGIIISITFISISIIMLILAIDSLRLKKTYKLKLIIAIIIFALTFITPVKIILVEDSNEFIEYRHSLYKNIYNFTVMTDGCNCEVRSLQ